MSFNNIKIELKEMKSRWVEISLQSYEESGSVHLPTLKKDIDTLEKMGSQLSSVLEISFLHKFLKMVREIQERNTKLQENCKNAMYWIEKYRQASPKEQKNSQVLGPMLREASGKFNETFDEIQPRILEVIDFLLQEMAEKNNVVAKTLTQEVQPPIIVGNQPQIIRDREMIREIVKIRCRYCHQLYDESNDHCPNCGGR